MELTHLPVFFSGFFALQTYSRRLEGRVGEYMIFTKVQFKNLVDFFSFTLAAC